MKKRKVIMALLVVFLLINESSVVFANSNLVTVNNIQLLII